MSQQHTPPVKGQGFNPDGGGFAQILIGDKAYPVARIVQCVNAHDELVAKAQALCDRLSKEISVAEEVAALRAAIAKTQGAAA